MDRYATYVRALTDAQEPTRQRNTINKWLSEHDVDLKTSISSSTSANPVLNPDMSNSSTSSTRSNQRTTSTSSDERSPASPGSAASPSASSNTVGILEPLWGSLMAELTEVRPDGTGRLIADISDAIAEEERRLLTKRIQAGVDRAQREGKRFGAVPKGFRHDDDGCLQVIREADRDVGEVSYLEMRTAIERISNEEAYRSVAADTPNLA